MDMAAFSSTSFHHHHSFLLDSVFLPNPPSNTSDNKSIMSISPPQLPNNINFNHQNLIHNLVDNDASVVNKNSMDNSSSIVTDKYDSSHEQPVTTSIKKKKRKCTANSAQSTDTREVKGKKQKKVKEDAKEVNKSEELGYIHVRAKRGQATDSHSLAERVRRERISERMKQLQALVPGCDKVTGKALMLDEIINYVQSLQNQVEFLSMKLASMNPMYYDFGMDLESFMVRPDQDLSELPSPMGNMQEDSPATGNNYNYMHNNSANPVVFQQTQLQNVIPQPQPQGSRQTLWEVDDHRQKLINQSGFNNTIFPFQ